MGQVIIDLTGVGPVQTGFVVALSISAAVAFRGSGAIIVQAASTAVLLGTVSPLQQHLAVPRTLNALIGGMTAVVVALLLLPLNPVRVVQRAAGTTLDIFTTELTAAATAICQRDDQRLDDALQRLRAVEQSKQEGFGILQAALEVARLSPWRRGQRALIQRYQRAAEHLDQTYTDSRETIRWALRGLRAGESIPPALPASIERLGQAVRLVHRDFAAGCEPDLGRARAEQAIQDIDRAPAAGAQFAGQAAVYQQRVALSALLWATGVPQPEANRRAGLPDEV